MQTRGARALSAFGLLAYWKSKKLNSRALHLGTLKEGFVNSWEGNLKLKYFAIFSTWIWEKDVLQWLDVAFIFIGEHRVLLDIEQWISALFLSFSKDSLQPLLFDQIWRVRFNRLFDRTASSIYWRKINSAMDLNIGTSLEEDVFSTQSRTHFRQGVVDKDVARLTLPMWYLLVLGSFCLSFIVIILPAAIASCRQ